MSKIFAFLFLLMFQAVSTLLHAQTDPLPQNLPFNFSGQAGSVLPAGIAVHRFGTTAGAIPLTRTLAPANADLPYNATASTGGWRDESGNGISMLASGSNAAGAMVIAINTTAQAGIQ